MLLEDAIGSIANCPTDAGCAAVMAWLAAHPCPIKAATIATLVGTHRFRSYALAAEIVRTIATILTTGDSPMVYPVRDALTEAEKGALVAAAAEALAGSVGAFVAEQRRAAVVSVLSSVEVAPSSPWVARLDSIITNLAQQCQFDRTGDFFLITSTRSMLPAAAVGSLAVDDTPYAVSFEALEDSNQRIGELFRQTPAHVLEQHAANPLSSVRLCLMMTVACEYLPLVPSPPIFFNGDIGTALERPAVFACDNFDCGFGDIIVVAADDGLQAFHCVSSAVMHWLHHDPRAHELLLAVVQPEALNPASVFARVTT
jgi:hypothetical protein